MNEELRAVFARLDAALAEARAARAALEKPEPEKPEPEPPCVEVVCAKTGATWLFSRIDTFELQDGRWRVWGHPRNANNGYGCDGCYILTDATPFSIWRECVAAGVPCPEPPIVTLHGRHTRNPYRYARIDTMHTVSDGTALTGWWAGNDAAWNTCDIISHVVAESPATIRAACRRAGVPCPPGEIVLDGANGATAHYREVSGLCAVMVGGMPCIQVSGTQRLGEGDTITTTPIADIRKQAAEAGIELPEVAVNIDSYRWTAIARADCHVCDDGSLLTGIIGVAERYGEHTIHTSTLTPAQVVRLCELAGWPKPEVRMVLTYADGSACELECAPADIQNAEYDAAFHATRVQMQMRNKYMYLVHAYVREPVAVVEAMRDACKEGE